MYQKSLFIFRRDLRLFDNQGLHQALRQSAVVLPVFIFDTRQTGEHDYFSKNAFQFLINSIQDLHEQLQTLGSRLYIMVGEAHQVLNRLVESEELQAVFVNRDYTPFSKKRDQALQDICTAHRIAFNPVSDLLLVEPEQALKADGNPYTVFTPFFNNARKIPVPAPFESDYNGLFKGQLPHSFQLTELPFEVPENELIAVQGGRQEGLDLLQKSLSLADYAKVRDIPFLDATTHLSAHLKFGTVSPREVLHQWLQVLGEDHALIRQLYWRDFFTHIAHHFPHVFGQAFNRKYEHIEWSQDQQAFERWKQGRTGFPIVDAGMRQLNTTGSMHNRLRMITASYLCKDLHIDWRWGERYFAQRLVDYDPCVNNGSWQWAASTGCDAQPYFRIFNPWLQQKKFDPELKYIRKWLPETHDLSHAQLNNPKRQDGLLAEEYPVPCVDHGEAARQAKMLFQSFPHLSRLS